VNKIHDFHGVKTYRGKPPSPISQGETELVEDHRGKYLAWIIQSIFLGRIINWQNNYFERKNRQSTAAKNECFACGF
jgi:hypothetical protein